MWGSGENRYNVFLLLMVQIFFFVHEHKDCMLFIK